VGLERRCEVGERVWNVVREKREKLPLHY
jgi:hypothetical protein